MLAKGALYCLFSPRALQNLFEGKCLKTIKDFLVKLSKKPGEICSVLYVVFYIFPEFNFALYPPSMIAAGSVSAAANGLLGQEWVKEADLMQRLQRITAIDMVRPVSVTI